MALIANGAKTGLYTNDLFWSSSPFDLLDKSFTPGLSHNVEHDFQILNLKSGVDLSSITEAFLSSSPYQWLCSTVGSEMYFGTVTNALHNDLLDDPAPYRKDVKGLVSNLLEWTKHLAGDTFGIDIPRHSQRVFRQSFDKPGRSTVSAGNKALSEDEWMITYLVYLSFPNDRLTATHPAVYALSRTLNAIARSQDVAHNEGFRSPDGLRGRLDVFALLDGKVQEGPGRRKVSSAENVWGKFKSDPKALIQCVDSMLGTFDIGSRDREIMFRDIS